MRSVAAAAVLLGAGLVAGHALADTVPVPVPTVSVPVPTVPVPVPKVTVPARPVPVPVPGRFRRARRSLPRPCPRRLPAPPARRPGRRPSLRRSARLPRRSARSSGARPGPPPHRGPPRRGAPARRVEAGPNACRSRVSVRHERGFRPPGRSADEAPRSPSCFPATRGWSWSSSRSRRHAGSQASSPCRGTQASTESAFPDEQSTCSSPPVRTGSPCALRPGGFCGA